LKKAGCLIIYLGIESGSQRILDYYKKDYTVEMIREKCQLIKDAGIDMACWFLIGAPSETVSDVEKSIRMALEIDATFICVNQLRPMPGTSLFFEQDKIKVSLFPFEVDYCPDNLNIKELASWRRRMYLKFYLSPKVVFRIIRWLFLGRINVMFFFSEIISVIRNKYSDK